MNMILYGIPNCDQVKKARQWLADHQLDAAFHNYKKDGVPTDRLIRWVAIVGWERLVNKSGTTWRKLPDAAKAAVTDADSAIALMLEQPSVIRRPVLEIDDGHLLVGFNPDAYAALTPVF